MDTQPDELGGWSNDAVADQAHGVVVAVRPDGQVDAFVLRPVLGRTDQVSADLYHLEVDDSVAGGRAWHWWASMGDPVPLEGSYLALQYCNDRLRTPIVFTHVPSQASLNWCVPLYPSPVDGGTTGWQTVGQSMAYDLADVGAPVVAGVDSPDLAFDQEPQVATVRIWTVVDGVLYLTTMHPRNGTRTRVRVSDLESSWRLVSIWSHPLGAGVVVAHDTGGGQTYLGYAVAGPGADNVVEGRTSLVSQIDDVAAWQDSDGLLHIYGRGQGDDLQVLHQTGWNTDDTDPMFGVMVPVFEEHFDDPVYMPTLRSLVGEVGSFAVDAYPDQMPSQFVHHQGAAAGEGCALYTQSVTTTYWAEERIRLVPEKLPKPYSVARYETTLTVKNAYGSVVPGCDLHLTADSPIDLEVAGRFYRTGMVAPITLTTDLRGKVTLRVMATGLYVPQMHITAPGMSQSVSLQQAADVHAFLGGTGTLPNHPDGFTADAVNNAKNPDDPDKPLFPNLKRDPQADGDWPPSAADVVTWCQALFAAEAGSVLPPAMLAGLFDGEEVRGFTLQTHDSDRPGFQVFTNQEGLEARRQALQAQGVTELEDWLGDIWQGIRQGLTHVNEVFIDLVDAAVEVVVTLADGTKQFFQTAFDSIVSAAHAVEAVFVAIGAKIQEAIDWLKWVFDFKDVWGCKKALDGGIAYFGPALTQTLTLMKDFADGWFVQQEEQVRAAFESMKAGVGNRAIGSFASPSLPDQKDAPASALVQDRVSDPHVSWFTEHLVRSGATDGNPGLPVPEGATMDPFDELIETLTNSPGWADLDIAANDLRDLVTNLFNFQDPQTFAAQELTAILDLFEHLVLALLELGDSVLDALVLFAEAMLKLVEGMLATTIESPLLEAVYEFVQLQAGVAPDQVVKPTIGGVATLLAAFPITILSKLIIGRPPFVDALPAIPADLGGLVSDTRDYPGGQVIEPPAWPSVMAWQVFQGLMMAVDGPFDVVVDASAYFDEDAEKPWFLDLSDTESRIFAGLHFICYGVGDCPWIWGNTFPPHPHVDASWLPPLSWAGSAIVNFVDVGCTFKNGYLLAKFDEDKTGIGPFTLTGFGVARIIISALRYEYIGTQSSTDVLNLWINVTSFESSASGFLRFLFKRNPALDVLMNVKVFVDLVCDLFAGIATTYQTLYTEINPPVVEYGGDKLPDATLDQDYAFQFKISGGWSPYSWDDASTQLPPGLTLDKASGVLSGRPTQAGTFTFRVQATDYSGPSFTFLTNERTLVVKSLDA